MILQFFIHFVCPIHYDFDFSSENYHFPKLNTMNCYSDRIYTENMIVHIACFHHCIFKSIKSQKCLGAVCVIPGTFSFQTFKNCTFTQCQGKNGGAIYMYYQCVKRFSCMISIKDSIFENNSADSNGGAIYIDLFGRMNLNNCSFRTNSAKYSGGSLYFNSLENYIIEKCNFINNSLFNDFNSTEGGSIFFNQCRSNKIVDCKFINNSVTSNFESFGGAISFFCKKIESKIELKKCEFENNFISSLSGLNAFGGAVYAEGTSNILNCEFTNNIVSSLNKKINEFAGALYLQNGEINDCNFNNNEAFNGCDIMCSIQFKSDLSIINCNFLHNSIQNRPIKSLIYFGVNDEKNESIVFQKNHFIFNMNAYLFDGEIIKSSSNERKFNDVKLMFHFDNNCIFPYDENNYKSESLLIYDDQMKELIPFNNAFKSCYQLMTQIPSKTVIQTPSKISTQTSSKIMTNSLFKIPAQTSSEINKSEEELFKKIIILLIVFIVSQIIIIILIIFLVFLIFKKTNYHVAGEPQNLFNFSEA